MKKLGIYIHIPFCVKKCIYCDFLSFPGRFSDTGEYFNALIKEIEEKSFEFKDYLIDTIFIGGGTPTCVDASYIKQTADVLRKFYNISDDCEFTTESNPGTLTIEKCSEYLKCGINRLSIGLQSADDNILKFLGRIHTFEEYKQSVEAAKKAGFKNINTDIIFGIPGQSMRSFKETLNKTVSLGISHISAYSLIPEENTVLYSMLENKTVSLPDDEIDREMYHYAIEFLKENGYRQYEISNFAKPGFECRHNLKYWEEKEYYGFGLGAASFFKGKRTKNSENFSQYIHGNNIQAEDFLIDGGEEKREYMMLGFRKTDGPDPEEFYKRYGTYIDDLFGDVLNKLFDKKLIEREYFNGKISKVRLSERGLDFANEVFEEFI